MFTRVISLLIVSFVSAGVSTLAQPATSATNRPPRGMGQQGPRVISPEVADHKITFRVLAPKAESVKLNAGDIPGQPQGGPALTKGASNVWEIALEVPPGSYRYNFNIDGVATIDPRNPRTSESNENTWSLVHVPGADFMDTKDVPHGAVAAVTYQSSALGRARRMHIYMPPGYELGQGKYPVFYLLHGASDSDDSWSSEGRAGFILDNLIAAKKAKPMIVVMPAGHTGPFRFGARSSDDFERDFVNDIMPYIEKNYRTRNDRQNRAIAGLSMGGAQTLNIAFAHLDKFAYIGVYSSGIFGINNAQQNSGPTWEEKHKTTLDNASLKKGLKLVWFATGKEDFLLKTSEATVDMLKQHKFDVVYKETAGAHTWINWREYLNEFVPQLFQ
jgi:enterochelin esterase family protein